MRRTFLVALVAALTVTAQKAAKEPVAPVHTDKAGLALAGYDAVAYFEEGKPVKGSERFTHAWNEARWQFSSAANRDAFAQDPAKYAPQFGGYCAWAVSNGYTAGADPEAWKIVDGKLYLNYNQNVQKQWEKEMTERIRAAERNWPGLHK
jgi:hypothetical protein